MNWPVTWRRWRAFSWVALGRGWASAGPRSARRCLRWRVRTVQPGRARTSGRRWGARLHKGARGWLPSRCDRPGIDMLESPARPCDGGWDGARGRRSPIRSRSATGQALVTWPSALLTRPCPQRRPETPLCPMRMGQSGWLRRLTYMVCFVKGVVWFGRPRGGNRGCRFLCPLVVVVVDRQ